MEAIRAMTTQLRLHAFHCYDARRSWGPGFPDLTICGHVLLFAEVKTEDGELTALQKGWARRLQGAGQRWVLWRPSNLASGDIWRTLRELDQLPETERETA